MSALGETLQALADVLDGERVGWFVFGAQAVAAHGAPRATQDVDVTVQIERDRLGGLVKQLHERGLTHRFPEIAEELMRSGAVLPLAHRSGMEVDLVLAASGLETLALQRATPLRLDGVTVPVAHPTDLVTMKILAGRGKDLDDVRALLATGRVDLPTVRDLLGQLEQALGQADLLPRLRTCLTD